jgi:ribosome-associated toxin RatA of RatAB toxin-antitoxin module
MSRTLPAGIVAFVLFAGVGKAGDAEWERLGERDGIAIESRDTGDSPVRELRLTARSAVPPAAIMATIWRHDEYIQFLPYLKRLDVLRDEGDTKLVYEQIRVPVVKDRDLTVRVTRSVSADTGTYEITSVAVPDEGPPETRDHVRVRMSAARWRLAPATDGGTDVTYTIRGDAGGRLPAWIVDAVDKDAAVKILRAMLDRARRNNP